MRVTEEKLKTFDDDGYLFFPGMFSAKESAFLKQESKVIYAMERKEVWRESSGAPRTAFAANNTTKGFVDWAPIPG